MFVTILFGILNRTTQRFSYARAGHEPPIFFGGKYMIQPIDKHDEQTHPQLSEQLVRSKLKLFMLYRQKCRSITSSPVPLKPI
jgi:serine phosphatase RsbU (regulator of sigma subunit)